jgi:hypothetical protein
VIAALAVALSLFAPAAAPAAVPDSNAEAVDLRAFAKESPRCPRKAAHCFGIVAHVVVDEDGPVESASWLAERVAEANRHFAPISVGFRVIEARPVAAEFWHLATREDRDRIGADQFSEGVVHLFLVGQLDDVDVPGEVIRGVHWRLRRDTHARWIIMSKIAAPMVLAHELGHFFWLPHSSYRVSIMNKTPRVRPPWEERTFARPEIDRMRGFLTYMLFFGELKNRR